MRLLLHRFQFDHLDLEVQCFLGPRLVLVLHLVQWDPLAPSGPVGLYYQTTLGLPRGLEVQLVLEILMVQQVLCLQCLLILQNHPSDR